jgi:hypothetical protein
MNNQEETKLISVLEFFLSLHEADEIYNDIFDDNVQLSDIENKLRQFINSNNDKD